MALLRKFFNQTRKPEGFLGKLMLSGMNSGHAKLADWGLTHLPKLSVPFDIGIFRDDIHKFCYRLA